ncbi:MAG: cytochrome C [Bacteroidota bacterium]|nr:cytochrome C [Bacteroidota bacterium]MDX5429789.1 cytochrome C [Bacteroidota bacterium]MDX5468568.1 cytochrome C [Bacteroidota bacterium]
MKAEKSKVYLFMDDEEHPTAILDTPVEFELDTRKLTDGQHCLRIISKSPQGREGIKVIPFIVRNGPAITVEGLKEGREVDGTIPLMIHAYDKGHSSRFMIEGSESPHSIPSWLWILAIGFFGWAGHYLYSFIQP